MPIRPYKTIKEKVMTVIKAADDVMRGQAVSAMEYESDELDHIFTLLVLGMFVGIPSPPIHITMELLPRMEKEFANMIEKVSTAHDPLGDLFSVLEID
jgi:late competence protein required for DNA uptake (superfamily II DNA/RNA helicase)